MAASIPQQSNPVVDMVDVLSKGLPLLFGSRAYSTTSTAGDPAELARSRDLQNMLMQRSTSTAQADQIVNDILYRAQLAFAPILGEEKAAGMYNTTVKAQLAKEAQARATAAAAQTILEDQQRSLSQAVSLQNEQTRSSRTQQTTQKTPSQAKNIFGTAAAMFLAGKGKNYLDKALEGFSKKGGDTAPDTSVATGDEYTAGLDEWLSTNFGAGEAVGTTGGVGDAVTSSIDGGVGSIIMDDTQALQEILNSTALPGAINWNTATASANTDVPVADAGGVATFGSEQVVTPLSMPPAQMVDPITGDIIPVMPAATPMMPPAEGYQMPPAIFDTGGDAAGAAGGAEAAEGVTAGADAAGSAGDIAGYLPYAGAAVRAAQGNARGAAGSAGGAALGSYFGGPVGGVIGSYIGGELAPSVMAQSEDFWLGIDNSGGLLGIQDPITLATNEDMTGEQKFNAITDPFGSIVTGGEGGTHVAEDVLHGTEDLAQQTITNPLEDTFHAITKGSIICTELVAQGKLRKRWYLLGAKEFANYDARGKQGYYFWSAPTVAYLKKNPDSFFSILVRKIFNTRAEFLAAREGDKTAKSTLGGYLATKGLYAFCWILSRTLARNYKYAA